MREGWICPRCKRVNAPFNFYCDCKENNLSNYAKNIDCLNGYHNWQCTGMSTAGTTYTCSECGKTKTEPPHTPK